MLNREEGPMKATHLASALALSLVVALSGSPAAAQHRGGGGGGGRGGGSHGGGGGWHGGGGSHGGGGGWHGGGGSHGGGAGYAVPRGSYGGRGAWHGGVSGARHPQAGTGYYGRYYNGYHGGYGHGGYYGGYYRPYYYGGYYSPYYYGGYYGSYYSPYFSLSLGFGSPYYYNAWPYAGVAYTYPSYSSGYYAPAPAYGDPAYSDDERQAPPPREAEPRAALTRRDSGSLRLEVRPEDTSVYVDDGFRGTAREARGMSLGPGRHTIELVRPGYATERREVEIVTGERSELLVEMQRPR